MQKTGDDKLNRFLSSEKCFLLKELYDDSCEGKCIYFNNKVVYFNSALSQLTGYLPKELFSFDPKNISSFVHPDFHSFLYNKIKEKIQGTCKCKSIEFVFIKKDKSCIWVEFSIKILEFDKQPLFLATLIDITEKKETENLRLTQYNELQIIHNLSLKISQTNDINEIYSEAFCGLKSLIPLDKFAVLLVDKNECMRFVYWTNLSEKYRKTFEPNLTRNSETQTFNPVIIADVEVSILPDKTKKELLKEGIKAFGIFPILYKNKLWGGISNIF